jgi:hypothetical protein
MRADEESCMLRPAKIRAGSNCGRLAQLNMSFHKDPDLKICGMEI